MSGHLPTTAETHPFLVRNWQGRIYQSPRLLVRWREVRRTKREYSSPMGAIREVEFDRWDKSQLTVGTSARWDQEGAPRVVTATGGDFRQGDGDTVPNSTAGVGKVARRITPEDAAAITEVDHDILRHQDAIADLRRQRSELVGQAWRNGRRFTIVHELRPEGDAPDARRIIEPEGVA